MNENINFSSATLILGDLDSCHAKLSAEMLNYSYEKLVLGVDCEWVSQERQGQMPVCPVALLQLAFPMGTCFLIRLCQMQSKMPEKLRNILEDKSILKTGVGISEDAKKLNSNYGIVMQGCVDLRHVASRCRSYVQHNFSDSGSREGMSLSALSQQILGVTMDKDWHIRCSNWEAKVLSDRQISYAANDAIVAVQIFFMLAASRLIERENRIDAGTEAGGSYRVEEAPKTSKICVKNDNTDSRLKHGVATTVTKSTCTEAENCLVSESCDITKDTHKQNDEQRNDKSTHDDSNDSSQNDGFISNIITKITNSFDSLLTTQIPGDNNRSKSKKNNYKQYESFKCIKLNETLLRSSEFWASIPSLCHGIVDLPYKTRAKHKVNKSSGADNQHGTSTRPTHEMSALKSRRAPLYQNCVIEAPDGEMLSTCDKRKAEWYLGKELAVVVREDPYTIRLKFEPSGRPFDPENNYYLTFKENLCVVCGRDDSYMRKNIIPHDYRKHFPACMKDHHSHDVLLLCPTCHMISSYHDDLLRRNLAEKYQAPLGSAQVARLVQDPKLQKVKCAAKALLYSGDKIPEGRRQELLAIVQEYFETECPTREMLLRGSELETRWENCDFVSHGREVVRKIRETDELLAFERMWREHFLESMKPKYLPPLWAVDHDQEKVRKLLEKELSIVA